MNIVSNIRNHIETYLIQLEAVVFVPTSKEESNSKGTESTILSVCLFIITNHFHHILYWDRLLVVKEISISVEKERKSDRQEGEDGEERERKGERKGEDGEKEERKGERQKGEDREKKERKGERQKGEEGVKEERMREI